MATVVTYGNNLRRIEYSLAPRGPRQMVRLGNVSMKVAETWKAKIEAIIADKLANRSHDPETAKWLGALDEVMLGRLRAGGLAEGVGLAHITLGDFLKRLTETMTGKPATCTFYGHTRRNLEDHFGTGKLVRDITAAEADGWRAWLVQHEQLSPATVARRVIAARTIWRKASRWKLASENPFAGVKGGHQENDARKFFVRRDVIDKVIAEAPNAEWRLIIALARYGGLRCPSEHYALKWGHVDWGRDRLTVHASKTEHHQGKGTRVVPIFPELLPYLRAAFEEAEPGTEYVIAKHRLGSLNLRQQFERIIERADVTPWPRLFQNLRASRETELMRDYDLATVCKWIGNSPAVAAKHYAMSVDLDADFRRAAGKNVDTTNTAAPAQQNAQQSAAAMNSQEKNSTGSINDKAPENRGFVDPCLTSASADATGGWAIQDSNL